MQKVANKVINLEINKITLLISSNRDNLNVIALLLCEMHFTSSFKRGLEYICLFLLNLVNHNRRYTISVGKGQIQFRHWIKYNNISQKKILYYFKQFTDIKKNYDLILRIFEQYNLNEISDSKIISVYRGETRSYHLNLFISIRKRLTALKSCPASYSSLRQTQP